ncbi:hypothetical protein [uncultured Nonlabens sp.]|uniref:hypothetical protein n=1 Tax=uncultured Nonlabens sp. TaxID=859306 RepID=UPI0030DB0725|tara:strand:- start:20617 stop:21426 length:810 start_codon:yes stop_codon:yes gene_type:complete
MRLPTKLIIGILLFLVTGLSFAQQDSAELAVPDSEQPKRLFLTDLYLQRGIPSGDNFAGNGLEGGAGYGIRMQFYVPKNFYLGAALTQDFMSVKSTTIVGEYARAAKFNAYVFAGYDYRLNEDWNITADLGYGYSQNKNRQSGSQGGGKFRDSGNVLRFTSSLEYHFSDGISFFFSPSYEIVTYRINTAPSLNDSFNNANYFNLAIGIRLNVRDYSAIRLKKTVNQDLQELLSRDPEDLSIKEKRRLYFLKKKEARRHRKERKNNKSLF